MGVWQGSYAMSQRGDWTHGPKLHLKYNSHSEGEANVPDSVAREIGEAYELALTMLDTAIDVTKKGRTGRFPEYRFFGTSESSESYYDKYFGKSPDLKTILNVLTSTKTGLLKAGKEKHSVYLFDNTSKPPKPEDEGTTMGYVAKYDDPTDKKKKALPKVNKSHRGHIHINFRAGSDRNRLARTIVHEGTHRFAGTADFAYADQTKFATLNQGEQLNNADSYAMLCRDLWMLGEG